MSERREKKTRLNLRLEYIVHFNKWLDAEPCMLNFIAWHRWKRQRPVWTEEKDSDTKEIH